eukprot:CAMPEP_0182932548 /NCGR_PEP_ID=MMETSP0105_2-20130417/31618_1 /TAXON_ID=81532 ORGANISM="Acanthoeca-like sp., Strain 10tr" /NCGR_SAMPLE_ID=MMETSP0105_2 /ASSEMBLY_ACC=CAM_ASM_000205 /LENGTH=31 /DNA_ID= /DNA_START= /DNA_END= /DNA_ORIENTATION=
MTSALPRSIVTVAPAAAYSESRKIRRVDGWT